MGPFGGRGPRLHPTHSRPGQGRRGCCLGNRRSPAGSGRRAGRMASRGARGPDSPCGAPGFGPSCSREWPRSRLQPCELRMRGGRPAAAQRQPGPAPARGTPAQPPARPRLAPPRPSRPRPSSGIWESRCLSPAPTRSPVASKPWDLVLCVLDAESLTGIGPQSPRSLTCLNSVLIQLLSVPHSGPWIFTRSSSHLWGFAGGWISPF